MSGPHLKVVPIGKPNVNNIPEMLERAAANIRSDEPGFEKPTQAILVIVVGESGFRRIEVYDYGPGINDGDASVLHAVGILEAAKAKILAAVQATHE